MIFKIHVKEKESGREWVEEYDKETENPEQWASDTLKMFNSTLRPNELAREVVRVEVVSEVNDHHKWVKLTSGQSVLFRGQIVDLHQCEKCGITGKRFGLAQYIKRDSKYKAKKYDKCEGRR